MESYNKKKKIAHWFVLNNIKCWRERWKRKNLHWIKYWIYFFVLWTKEQNSFPVSDKVLDTCFSYLLLLFLFLFYNNYKKSYFFLSTHTHTFIFFFTSYCFVSVKFYTYWATYVKWITAQLEQHSNRHVFLVSYHTAWQLSIYLYPK